ncbi:MAG: DUF4976 domain-containing protein, partial [Pedosphaera sp.]|nr:DUF4976 domain-containing protein [Pedosphaera sp.]
KTRRVAVSTQGKGNHAVRSSRFRYIRYADGSEELYDHKTDPHEWHNLAAKPEHKGTIAELREHLPKVNSADAPGRPPAR